MRLLRGLITTILLIASVNSSADSAILIHGWAASADTWKYSGVQAQMLRNGWSDGGVVAIGADGQMRLFSANTDSSNRFYRVALPAQQPLLMQARILLAQVNLIKQKHPNEKITLVGHSAGGLVARLMLLNRNAPAVHALVTIATPNLGTGRAIDGLEIVDSKPFFCPGPGIDFLKSVVGGDDYEYLKYSRAAVTDMLPAEFGGLISWMNQQPHPDIEYHAIIKQIPGENGDGIVTARSQDLGQVAALYGKVKIYPVRSEHALNPSDGNLIHTILTR